MIKEIAKLITNQQQLQKRERKIRNETLRTKNINRRCCRVLIPLLIIL